MTLHNIYYCDTINRVKHINSDDQVNVTNRFNELHEINNDNYVNQQDNEFHESPYVKKNTDDDNLHMLQGKLNDNCIFNSAKIFYAENINHFKISHINVNSIRHKFEPFREVLNEYLFDIVCIQETKIDDTFPEGQFTFPLYKVYRNYYRDNEGGLI